MQYFNPVKLHPMEFGENRDMSAQELFGRTVRQYLPSAIPSHLERIDEYSAGKVLVYRKQPKRLMPWRKNHLNFTGFDLSSLLAEGQALKVSTASDVVFDTGTGTRKSDADLNLDAQLKDALVGMGVTLKSSETKNLSLVTKLGKITHIKTDLFQRLQSKTYKLDLNHLVVKKALHEGGTLFVISTLYQADVVNIQIEVQEKVSEAAGASASVPHSVAVKTDEQVGDDVTLHQG